MIILEENFKWHLEAFASELFMYSLLNKGACDSYEAIDTYECIFTKKMLLSVWKELSMQRIKSPTDC